MASDIFNNGDLFLRGTKRLRKICHKIDGILQASTSFKKSKMILSTVTTEKSGPPWNLSKVHEELFCVLCFRNGKHQTVEFQWLVNLQSIIFIHFNQVIHNILAGNKNAWQGMLSLRKTCWKFFRKNSSPSPPPPPPPSASHGGFYSTPNLWNLNSRSNIFCKSVRLCHIGLTLNVIHNT